MTLSAMWERFDRADWHPLSSYDDPVLTWSARHSKTVMAWHDTHGGDWDVLPMPSLPPRFRMQLEALMVRFDGLQPDAQQEIRDTVDRILWVVLGVELTEIWAMSQPRND